MFLSEFLGAIWTRTRMEGTYHRIVLQENAKFKCNKFSMRPSRGRLGFSDSQAVWIPHFCTVLYVTVDTMTFPVPHQAHVPR